MAAVRTTVTEDPVWGTSRSRTRCVSSPEPAGCPTGLTGPPHPSPTEATLGPVYLSYGPNTTPSIATVYESLGAQESMACTTSCSRSRLCGPSPDTTLLATSPAPKTPNPPRTVALPHTLTPVPPHASSAVLKEVLNTVV